MIRWSEIAQIKSARYHLKALIADGSVIKVRKGVYAAANPADLPELLRGLRPNRILSARQRSLLDLLALPRTAPELVRLTSVTRQAIYQSLDKLVKRGLVRRHTITGEGVCLLYIRSDVRFEDAARSKNPLNTREELLLNSIPSYGAGLLSDVRAMMPSYSGALKRLIDKGLVEKSLKTSPRVVRVTRLGVEHAQYRPEACRLKLVAEGTLLRPEKLSLLLALGALSTADSQELQARAELKRTKRVYAPQLLGEMKRSGWIEQINPLGSKSVYALTAKGKDLVIKAQCG